jgi:predicted Zn finger-like uncharacterized protein
MIITCINCKKKFDIDSGLIPEKGRLLQCNSCNYKWFFKKSPINSPESYDKINKTFETTKIFDEKLDSITIENTENLEILDKKHNEKSLDQKIIIHKDDHVKNLDKDLVIIQSKKNNYNIFGLIIVFTITFIAIVIILDTFQITIGKIVPSIEFKLYNLYETINDIGLFLKDLI